MEQHRASTAVEAAEALTALLRETSMPARTVEKLVSGAPPLWLTSEAPATLATDLALCHPKLARGEVRAVARPIEGTPQYRLTVVAEDRSGLLADTCAVLADRAVDVVTASAMTWGGLALHSLVVDPNGPLDDARLEGLGDRLRAMYEDPPIPDFEPIGRAVVDVSGSLPRRSTITVEAKDQVGLLWAICRWLADSGVSIEAVDATTEFGVARDTFIVTGDCVPDALAAWLSKPERARVPA